MNKKHVCVETYALLQWLYLDDLQNVEYMANWFHEPNNNKAVSKQGKTIAYTTASVGQQTKLPRSQQQYYLF